jgi:hypothetical protein
MSIPSFKKVFLPARAGKALDRIEIPLDLELAPGDMFIWE